MMNREIKFRGLRVEHNPEYNHSKWKFGNLLNNNSIGDVGNDLDHYEYAKVIEDSVGQYIGLKDDHGTDIYEGDIIKSNPAELMYLPNNLVGFIKWDQTDCRFVWRVNNIDHTMSGLLHVIIIGNIYENPELLK